jgi:GT2 family glycosyltransferase
VTPTPATASTPAAGAEADPTRGSGHPAPAALETPAAPEAPAPKLSIIVVSYNTREMTLDCLRSVAAETRTPHEVIVLDNVSPDGSAAAIAEAFPPETHPELRLIASAENHGFAKGNNIAARAARGEYLLLLNPDTLILDGAIDKLMAFAERTPEAGIWGGRTLKGDGTLDPSCAFGDQTLWSLVCRTTGLSLIFKNSALFNKEYYGGWQRDSERAVGTIMGCFLLIRRDLWDALGGFDLSFVMYGEETDLCRRARDQGLAQPRLTPEAEIIHYGGGSAPKVSRDILKLKARVTLAKRHLPAWQRPLAVWMIRVWPLTRKLSGGIIARLTGRPEIAGKADIWGEIWTARAEWQDGYPFLPRSDEDGARGTKLS